MKVTYMGLLRALYRPDRSLLRERLRWRSLLRLRFFSRLLLLFLLFFLSLLLLLLLLFLEPGLRLLLRLLLFLKCVKNKINLIPELSEHLSNNKWFRMVRLMWCIYNILLALLIMSVCMRRLDLILSKVDRRTSWGRRWNISSRHGKGDGVGQEKMQKYIQLIKILQTSYCHLWTVSFHHPNSFPLFSLHGT